MIIQPPVRVAYTYTQQLQGAPDKVFPLLCPVREVEWVPGWAPRLVVSASGVAEDGCAFVTPDGETASGEPREATWVVTAHEPARGHVAMIKVSPGYLVTRLWIDVAPGAAPRGSRASRALVRYEYTALGPEGEAFVRARTPEAWAEFMRGWERAVNEYLARRPARDS